MISGLQAVGEDRRLVHHHARMGASCLSAPISVACGGSGRKFRLPNSQVPGTRRDTAPEPQWPLDLMGIMNHEVLSFKLDATTR